jgi:hypothetical protein
MYRVATTVRPEQSKPNDANTKVDPTPKPIIDNDK